MALVRQQLQTEGKWMWIRFILGPMNIFFLYLSGHGKSFSFKRDKIKYTEITYILYNS